MKALVIVVDGLHLGYVGGYGNDWIGTPTLDELAATGIVFDQHLSDHPEPAGARRSWRTGHLSLPAPDVSTAPLPDVDLVALLRRHAIPTTLIIDGSRPHMADFAAGWDHVEIVAPDDDGTPLERTLEAMAAALERRAELDNWLIWVELATLRPPWEVPDDFLERYFLAESDEEEAELEPLTDPDEGRLDAADDTTFARLQRTYAAAVTYLDAGLGLLVEELDRLELTAETLLLVTSDHGLPLGEHGVIGLARPWLHDELIHVPLLVRWPGVAAAGRRLSGLTQAVDLCPTLLDAFGVPLPAMHGRSLLPLIQGRTEAVRDYACCGLHVGDAMEWALRTPDWAFLLPVTGDMARSILSWEGEAPAEPPPPARREPRPPSSGHYDTARAAQLYVKPDDRWEVNDLRQHHLGWAEQLEQTLRDFVAASRQPGQLQAPPLPEELAEP